MAIGEEARQPDRALAAVSAWAAALLMAFAGCATKDMRESCGPAGQCRDGYTCNAQNECVPIGDGGLDTIRADAERSDAPVASADAGADTLAPSPDSRLSTPDGQPDSAMPDAPAPVSADADAGDVAITDARPDLALDSAVDVRLTLNKTSATLNVGETDQLVVYLQPSTVPADTLTWQSSDPAVATVSGTGLVNATGPGKAIITVASTQGGSPATYQVTTRTAAQWIMDLGAMQVEAIRSTAFGTLYIIGTIDAGETVDFGSGVTATAGSADRFVLLKIDALGRAQWAGVYDGDYPWGFATSPNEDVYVYFGIPPGEHMLGNGVTAVASEYSYALAKFNSNGLAQWVRVVRGGNAFGGGAVATDRNGNVYIVGGIDAGSVYEFGNGVRLALPAGCSTGDLTPCGSHLVKFDENGNAQWARGVNSPSRGTVFRRIAIDSAGNIYCGGFLGAIADFGGGVISKSNCTGDACGDRGGLVKYLPDGSPAWVRRLTYHGSAESLVSMTVDSSGNLFAIIRDDCTGTCYFDPGVAVTTGNGIHATSLLVKFAPDGIAQWARYPIDSDAGYAAYVDVQADTAGDLYLTGEVDRTVVVSSGGELSVTGDGGLLAKLSDTGVAQWALSTVGGVASYFDQLTVVGNGDIYATGLYAAEPVDFGNGVMATLPPDTNDFRSFLVKYR